MRPGHVLIVGALLFIGPRLTAQNATPTTPPVGSRTIAATPASLAGTWRSAAEETKLTGSFEESVWGRNAVAVRTVELTVQPSGQATLLVNRKVVDAKGRTVAGSASIEEAQILIGAPQAASASRLDHEVKVVKAERRYPDDPKTRWALDGLVVKVVTFEDGDGNTMEIRFDTPEGRGSFWETLRRAGKSAPRRTSG